MRNITDTPSRKERTNTPEDLAANHAKYAGKKDEKNPLNTPLKVLPY